MRKTISFLLTLVLFCGAATAVAAPAPVQLAAPVQVEHNGLMVAVDPRLELLSIVQYIGTDNINVRYGLMSNVYTQYKNDIDNYFRQFDEHPAVRYFDETTMGAVESGAYAFDEPVSLILFMRDDFTVDEEAYRYYQDTYEAVTWDTPEKLQAFFDLLRDFYVDTGFEGFYTEHRAYYDTIVRNTVDLLPEENLIGYMEDFFGDGADGYAVNLVTLFHSGGFAGESRGEKGHFIYANIGPDSAVKHIPTFQDTAYFTELEAHEFGHSFIPIASEKASPFANEIKATEYLFAAVAEDMEKHAYGAWDTALEETILRACVVRIMERYDARHAARLLQEERDNGFLYIDSVYESLGWYIENRAEYPDLQSFLPVVFENLLTDHPA